MNQQFRKVINNIFVVHAGARKVYRNWIELATFLLPACKSRTNLFQNNVVNFINGTILLKKRNEMVRRHKFLVLIIPADQCLGTLNLFFVDIKLWLKVYNKFIILNCSIHVSLNKVSPENVVVHLVCINCNISLI